MLKIVPDPPAPNDIAHRLEDTRLQIFEYLICTFSAALRRMQVRH